MLGERDPFIQWQSLATPLPAVIYKLGNVFDELGDVARNFSDKVEDTTGFLLAAYSKTLEKRHTVRGKDPRFAVFEDSRPLQMATDAEIKKYLLSKDQIQDILRKAQSQGQNKYVTVKSFAKTSGISKGVPQSIIQSKKRVL